MYEVEGLQGTLFPQMFKKKYFYYKYIIRSEES